GEHQRDLLMAVASQAAIAVQNARLFEEAEGRAEYERLLREITAQVRASTNADTIMRTAVRELGSALDRPAFIRLGRGEWGNREPESRKGDEAREYSGEAVPSSSGGYPARGYSGEARGYSGEGGE
ncbi:MAG TPA: hypothetical protein VLC95_02335, partial [Anaerolineae bacterium]|nr:hypothetical protein [Anaerolineae bacterium]